MNKKHPWSKFEYALDGKQFLVTVNNKKLYGGLFTYPGSTTSAPFPVIYPTIAKIISEETVLKFKIKLTLRPQSKPITEPHLNYKMLNSSIKKQIEFQEIYELFSKRGKLTFYTGFCYDQQWVLDNMLKLDKCPTGEINPFP